MEKPREDLSGVLRQMRELQSKYNTLSMEAMFRAYDRAMINNPWIQNKRVKQTTPCPLSMARTRLPRPSSIRAAMNGCSGEPTTLWKPPHTPC